MRRHFSLALAALAFFAVPISADIGGITTSPVNLPAQAEQLAVGPDGNVWILTNKGNVGKFTPTGSYTEFTLQFTRSPNGGTLTAVGFAFGSDGNLWVTGTNGHVERVTRSGAVTDFAVGPDFYFPFPVVTGADGAVWFFGNPQPAPSASNTWQLTRVDIYGQPTTYDLGISDSFPSGDQLTGLVSGGDGSLWFIDQTKNQVIKFSLVTKSVAGSFAIPSPEGNPSDDQMILAWDGNVWFTRGTSIDRVTPDGTITEFHVPSGGQPAAILMGGDNNIWFTEPASGRLGQLVMSSITSGGSATINESNDAVLSDVTGFLILPPAFAGSSGAPKLGIGPNDSCSTVGWAADTRKGEQYKTILHYPPPCNPDDNIKVDNWILGSSPDQYFLLLVFGGQVPTPYSEVTHSTSQSSDQTITRTATLSLSGMPGVALKNIETTDPSASISFTGLRATITSSAPSFSVTAAVSRPPGTQGAVAGAAVFASTASDPDPRYHISSFFLDTSSFGGRIALPSNSPTVITMPIARGK